MDPANAIATRIVEIDFDNILLLLEGGSEAIFHRKLQNSRITRSRSDPSEVCAIDRSCWIARVEVIKDIEGFSPEFDPLLFIQLEAPRERRIDVPYLGTAQCVAADIPPD